jgi:hypothetical protein
MNILALSILISFLSLLASPAQAGWSWGLGYHNPPGATLGVNFMHLWNNWAFEAGLGYLGSSETSTQNSQQSGAGTTTNSDLYAGGDINLKYLFASGFFRPYLQGGMGSAVSLGNSNNSKNNSNNTGANASLNGGFAGAGIFLLGSEFYVYLSYLTSGNGTFQFGLGFN